MWSQGQVPSRSSLVNHQVQWIHCPSLYHLNDGVFFCFIWSIHTTVKAGTILESGAYAISSWGHSAGSKSIHSTSTCLNHRNIDSIYQSRLLTRRKRSTSFSLWVRGNTLQALGHKAVIMKSTSRAISNHVSTRKLWEAVGNLQPTSLPIFLSSDHR